MKNSALGRRIIACPYYVWAAIFIIVPLIMIVYYSVTNPSGNFTLDNFLLLKKYGKAFLLSITYALISTVVTFFIAYPLSYAMTKLKMSSQRLILMMVIFPMWMNFLIRTYSWISILANTGIINNFLVSLGFEPLKLINTPGAIILGMVYDFLPYMVLPIYTAMSKIDRSLLEASDDLGCNGWQKLKKVIFPLTLPGVVSGITMVFVPSVSTFYISQKLGGNKTMLIGDAIEYLFNIGPDHYNVASTLSLVLMVLILISMAIMNRFTDETDEGVII